MNIWRRFPTWTHCGLGIKIKITDFYPPWKIWQEFNTFDLSQPCLSLPKLRSQEMLDAEISLLPRLQNSLIQSSGLYIQLTYCERNHGGFSTLWRFFLHLHFWWHFLEVKSLAQPKHFLQHYSLAHSQSYATVGWGSIASERLLFDI